MAEAMTLDALLVALPTHPWWRDATVRIILDSPEPAPGAKARSWELMLVPSHGFQLGMTGESPLLVASKMMRELNRLRDERVAELQREMAVLSGAFEIQR